jgi:4-amino-4-deoxy-L-arabinose transferase-like glycosyltransferase
MVNFRALIPKIPHSVVLALLIIVISKILVLGIGYATTYINQGDLEPLTILSTQFNRWDAPHYLDIARYWYVNEGDPANFIVFFPLYPILIRLATIDFNTINLSALIVANVSSMFAFLYLYKLAKLEFGDGIAVKAVLFMSIFPTAYFLSAPYTEGLFFALTIACLYYARTGKWQLAGVLAFFATLTRLAGLLLLPALIVEYLHQRGWKPWHVDLKILWILLPIVGFLIYLNINNQVTGSPFTFMVIERVHWYNYLDPLEGLNQAIYFSHKPFPDGFTLGTAPIAFGFFGLIMVISGFLLRLRPSLNSYLLLSWMLAMSTSFWISVPRYIMAAFPIFFILALISKRKIVTLLISTVFIALLCLFTVLFALHMWAF